MRTTIAAALMLGTLLLIPWLQVARAQDQVFAGRSIAIAPPQGYCALDPTQPQDAALLAQQQKLQQQSKLALMFLDCGDLNALRDGGSAAPQRYGTALVLEQQGEVHAIANASRTDFVHAVARPLATTNLDDIRRQLGRPEQAAAEGGIRVLGVIKADERAVYLAVAIDSVSVDGKPTLAGIVGVTAITLVNRIPLSLNLYQVKGDVDAVAALLSDQQHYVEALLAANAAAERPPVVGKIMNPEGSLLSSIDLRSPVVLGAVAGALVALVATLAALSLRRRKRPTITPKEPIPPA